MAPIVATRPTVAEEPPTDHAETASVAPEPEAEPVPEPAADPVAPAAAAPPPPPPRPAPEPARRGGFMPLFLGGVIAAALGFGAAWWLNQSAEPDIDLAAELEARDATIADLEARVAELQADAEALAEGPDLSALQASVDEASGTAEAARTSAEAAAAALAALEARLVDLEQRPEADGSLSSAAVEAYEREIASLREEAAAAVAAITGRVEQTEGGFADLRAEIEDRLAAMQAEAEAIESQSEEAAQAAAARAALAEIQAAVNGGAPFADALAILEGTGAAEVPPALSETAESGVASLTALRAAYPEAAREALAAARSDEGGGGLGGFLERQLNVRSVEPREGDDADAVLSRAGAAVTDGRIDDALSEVSTLEGAAAEAISDWVAAAEARAAAQAAVDQLITTLTTN